MNQELNLCKKRRPYLMNWSLLVGQFSLEDFNLYVFRGLRGEFKDLITSLITKIEPLSYADLHSHLLTHEFLYKSSAAIHAPLLPTPSIPSSALVAQR